MSELCVEDAPVASTSRHERLRAVVASARDATHALDDALYLPTTLARSLGAYTVALHFGRARSTAHLVLDTGSSALVVLPHAYDPSQDEAVQATPWAQTVRYGQGVWAGPVVRAMLHLGIDARECSIEGAPVAIVEAAVQDLRGADGILGLAYGGLDTAHDVTEWLTQRGTAPTATWPWPFNADDVRDLNAFGTQLRTHPRVPVTPLFTLIEEAGLVQDRFALWMQRAVVHVPHPEADAQALLDDPLNDGALVLGGDGETLPHAGDWQDVQVVHELYYNVEVIAVQVGDGVRIPAPPLAEQDVHRAASNGFVDTGCSFLILEASVYDNVLAAFDALDPRLSALLSRFQKVFETSQAGIANEEVDALDWPDLRFVLRAPDGGETTITCTGEQYWPRNALRHGESLGLLMRQLPGWPAQSILGLPLLAGCVCMFDRGASSGGRLRIATAAAG